MKVTSLVRIDSQYVVNPPLCNNLICWKPAINFQAIWAKWQWTNAKWGFTGKNRWVSHRYKETARFRQICVTFQGKEIIRPDCNYLRKPSTNCSIHRGAVRVHCTLYSVHTSPIIPKSTHASKVNELKSVNLQYDTLERLDDGTNESSTKRLMFQVLFFSWFLAKFFAKILSIYFLISLLNYKNKDKECWVP